MNGVSSLKSLLMDYGRNAKESWIDTFYFSIPNAILDMKRGLIRITDELKPKYFDTSFSFHFLRTSEFCFKIICMRNHEGDSIPDGEYKIKFYCNINVFGEDTKTLEMHSNGTVAVGDFSLKASYEDLSSNVLEKQLEFMILVYLIEYDCVLTDQQKFKEREFREKNPQLYDRSMLNNFCYVLSIPNLEGIFGGRRNLASIEMKRKVIERLSKKTFAADVAEYVRSRKASTTTEPHEDLIQYSKILKYLLHGRKGTISDKDLKRLYIEAHYLELKFLIDLSRDCLLHRLSIYENLEVSEYENLMFEVLKAAVRVNDQDLLYEAELKLKNIKKEFCNSATLLEKFKQSCIVSRFVIHSLKQRLRNRESITRIGTGEDSITRFFESLEIV